MLTVSFSCPLYMPLTALLGHSPTALEWDMKLWWVPLESLVATLMAYRHTNSQKHRDNFLRIFNYSFNKVSLSP